MNPLSKLARPRLPSSAVGLTGSSAVVISLDRRRDAFVVKRAGIAPLPEGLLLPGFDESNVADVGELARLLASLAESTGLARKRRWSIALPEAAARTAILTLESASASRAETEEMLRWKIERSFGAGADELRVSRQRLRGDSQGRARFLATAARASVLAEYESVFDSLGWRAGLLLPRHMGEEQWLMRGGRDAADSLLVSSHAEGFTAALLRDNQPLLVRSITCDPEDRADELYRFLLFYRDRMNAPNGDGAGSSAVVSRMLVAGQGIEEDQALAIVEETLSARPRLLRAEEARLTLPSHELPFAQLAAPAGLAALAFG